MFRSRVRGFVTTIAQTPGLQRESMSIRETGILPTLFNTSEKLDFTLVSKVIYVTLRQDVTPPPLNDY